MLTPLPCHCHGLQKRLLSLLWVIAMALHRPTTSSICIKGKACASVESNYYYNDFVLFTFCAASRSVTPIEAPQEAAILTTKTICWPSAILRIQHSISGAFKNALIFWKRRKNVRCNAASSAMVQIGGWQKESRIL